MNNENLDFLIQLLKERRHLPPCPSHMEANVLRRIRLDRADAAGAGIPMVPGAGLTRSAAAAAAALMAVLLGVTTAFGVSTAEIKHARERKQIVSALDFDVFRDQSLRASIGRRP